MFCKYLPDTTDKCTKQGECLLALITAYHVTIIMCETADTTSHAITVVASHSRWSIRIRLCCRISIRSDNYILRFIGHRFHLNYSHFSVSSSSFNSILLLWKGFLFLRHYFVRFQRFQGYLKRVLFCH